MSLVWGWGGAGTPPDWLWLLLLPELPVLPGCRRWCWGELAWASSGLHHRWQRASPHWLSDRQAGSGCSSFSWGTCTGTLNLWRRKNRVTWPQHKAINSLSSGTPLWLCCFKSHYYYWLNQGRRSVYVTRCCQVLITKDMNVCIEKWNKQVSWQVMNHVDAPQVSAEVLKMIRPHVDGRAHEQRSHPIRQRRLVESPWISSVILPSKIALWEQGLALWFVSSWQGFSVH